MRQVPSPKPFTNNLMSEIWEILSELPYTIFGLPFYTIQLIRSKIPKNLRRTVTLAVIFSWIATALMATTIFVLGPEEASLTYKVTGAICFSTLIATLAGMFLHFRVKYLYFL